MAEIVKFSEIKRKDVPQGEERVLTDQEFEEFRKIFSDTIINLADCADRHNLDRDGFIRYFAAMLKTTADISSFYQFESQKEGRQVWERTE